MQVKKAAHDAPLSLLHHATMSLLTAWPTVLTWKSATPCPEKSTDSRLLPPDVEIGPGLDMVSMAPVDKMGEPGIGLGDVKHRVLNYRMLSALEPNQDTREASRLLEIHLTGNMERYMWSFDGRMFSSVDDIPIRFAWNERVRVKLVNNTMMAHPIHLHGMFF